MHVYRLRLLTNAVLFLREAVAEYAIFNETDPACKDELSLRRSKAVIYIHLAAEMIMKKGILENNWRDIFARPEHADKSRFRSGDFKSISYTACLKYLESHSAFSKAELKVFERLAVQRNKVFHFAHAITSASLKSLLKGTARVLLDYLNKDEETARAFGEEINEIKSWSNEFTRYKQL